MATLIATIDGRTRCISVDFQELKIDGQKYETEEEFNEAIHRIEKAADDFERRDWIAAVVGPVILLIILMFVFGVI